MESGKANTDALVKDFVTFRKYLETQNPELMAMTEESLSDHCSVRSHASNHHRVEMIMVAVLHLGVEPVLQCQEL